MRVAVGIESLEVGGYAGILLFDGFPVLCVVFGDEGRDWLADCADSGLIRTDA